MNDCDLDEMLSEINCTSKELDYESYLSSQQGEPSYKLDKHKRKTKRMEFCNSYRNIVNIEPSNSRGVFIINNKFLYSPNTGRWRVDGKKKFYRTKNMCDFIYKYVLKNDAYTYQNENESEILALTEENKKIKETKIKDKMETNKDYDEVKVLKDLLEATRLNLIDALDSELVSNRTIEIQKELLDGYRKRNVSILWGLISF